MEHTGRKRKRWRGPRWRRSKVTLGICAMIREHYGKVPPNTFKNMLFNYIDGKLRGAFMRGYESAKKEE